MNHLRSTSRRRRLANRCLSVALAASLLVGLAGLPAAASESPSESARISGEEIADALDDSSQVLEPSRDTATTPIDADTVAAVSSGVLTAEIPSEASAGIEMTIAGKDVAVSLPEQAGSEQAQKLSDGTVVYPSDNGSASAVVAADNGIQMMTIISTSTAPTNFTYTVDMPEGGQLELASDGAGATVFDAAGTPVLAVPSPWAKDANGAAIATHFETDGQSLTQVVDHQVEGVSYPVVADPIWFVVSGAVFWWAVQRCGAGGAIGAVFDYVGGDRSARSIAAAGAAGCIASFVGGWGILRNLVRVVRW